MGTTERVVVDLPSELVASLREAVRRGDFGSEGEALSAILRALQGGGDVDEDIEALRTRVAEGMAEADAGEFVEADAVHADLRALIKATAERRG